MKTIKSLLAVSVLAAAGVANAAVVETYTVSVVGTTTGLATGSLTGTGTATFDDAGILTVDYVSLNVQPSAGGNFNVTNHLVLNGTISGNLFTTTSGSTTPVSCTAGTTTCPAQLGVGKTVAISNSTNGLFEQAFNITAGGDNTETTKQFAGALTNKATFTFTPNVTTPTVPVPAAAWLFGSGLVGVAGAARRRRSV